MPTYVYKFIDTGETIEVQQGFTDETLTEAVHPGTGATMAVKKVFTPVGVTFKGGGFYKTDSRGGGSKKAASTAEGGDTAATPAAASGDGAGATPAPAATPAATTPAPAAAAS